MKAKFNYLFYIAIALGFVSLTLTSIFTHLPWVNYTTWGITILLFAGWLILDRDYLANLMTSNQGKNSLNTLVIAILCILTFSGVAYLTSKPRFNKTLDLTKSKLNTLNEQSLHIIRKINDDNIDIAVKAFFSDPRPRKQFEDLINLYQSKGLKLKINYFEPNIDIIEAKSAQVNEDVVVIFNNAEREARISLIDEEKITNALIKLLKQQKKKAYLTMGHGESEINASGAEGLAMLKQEFEQNQYEIEQFSIIEKNGIPDDADMVAILGPKFDLSVPETEFLEQYLLSGGSVLISVDAAIPLDNLNNFIQKYGITLNNDFLILRPDDLRSQVYGTNNAFVSEFDSANEITRDFATSSQVNILIPNTRSLSVGTPTNLNFRADAIAHTNPLTVRVKDVKNQSDLKNITKERLDPSTQAIMAVSIGQIKPSTETTLNEDDESVENNSKQARLVVIGSSNLGNNIGLSQPPRRNLFLNTINYLMADEDFITITPPKPGESNLDLTTTGSRVMLRVIVFLYPFIFLFSGLINWARRRRA